MPQTKQKETASGNGKGTKGNNIVRWFEIYVQDMNRAKKFYESVFQVKLKKLETPDMDYWSFPDMQLDRAGTSGALVKMEGVKSGANSVIIYFACEDCAVEAERAKKFGGKVFKEKFSIGEYGAIALVNDTEGNMIGLHSME